MITTTPVHRRLAFTLVEMIGVMAIMAILAGVMVPNVLRVIERTAVRAEADNLASIGDQMRLYLRDNATTPSTATWNTQLAVYSSLSATDILTNKRQMNRLYVPDPVTANQRAMVLSSMRNGVALPTLASVSSNFTAIWNTADGTVPAVTGWTAWNSNNIEFLVIERVNFSDVYRTYLQTYTITLNNLAGTTASYQVTQANGTVLAAVNVAAGATPSLTLYPRDRVNLYRSAGAVTLVYSYVVSTTGKTFDFNGTNWTPQ